MNDALLSRRQVLVGASSLAAGMLARPARAESTEQAAGSLMVGYPPNPDRVVRFADGSYRQWPHSRWTANNIQELMPTSAVWRGAGDVSRLESSFVSLEGLAFKSLDGRQLSFQKALDETYTDGLLVLHKGRIVFEQYFGYCGPQVRHMLQSATKSLVGAITEDLIQEGILDRDKLVPHYIPELAGSAWGDATLGDVMNMQVAMKFDEDYGRLDSEIYTYMTSAGMIVPQPGYDGPVSFYQYLPRIQKHGEHGKVFAYREPCINVQAWLLRRALNKSLVEIFEEKLWQPLGVERDAYFMLDGWGAETALCATLRDFARFGEMIRNLGKVGDRQILNPRGIEHIFGGGDMKKFAAGAPAVLKNGSYVSNFWMRHYSDRIVPTARGAYGQFLHIDAKAEVVIARFGSAKSPSSSLLEPVLGPLFTEIVSKLEG